MVLLLNQVETHILSATIVVEFFLGSYSRVKAHLLKISNKGIRACDTVTPSHRLEMQRMHDQVENNKLERECRSQIPLP